jgi:hypothetical protein
VLTGAVGRSLTGLAEALRASQQPGRRERKELAGLDLLSPPP